MEFAGTDLQNRVDTTNFPGLYRYRLMSITNETGGVTGITHGTPDACTASYVESMTTNAEAQSNTDSCYPVWWTPSGYTAPVMDWFEKYAVIEVLQSDTTGGALADQTDYSYAGQLAGQPLETTVYDGEDGPVGHSAVYSYWVSGATATESQAGLPDLTANFAAPAEVWTRQRLTEAATSSWWYTETDTTATDSDFGLPEYAYTHTVPVDSAYGQCTADEYAPVNTSENRDLTLTCMCNGCCEHDHQIKQHKDWDVTQPAPGFRTWKSPSGRTCTSQPRQYPT